MLNPFFARTVIVSLLALVGFGTGCGGSSVRAPFQPTVSATPPSVAAISPNTGSTAGSTTMKITGTGFESGATVTLGGASVKARFYSPEDGKTMYLDTPAHEAGTVDIVVTNPGGQTGRLTGGYTYAPPQTFDFNGDWVGVGADGHDIEFAFTIHNNVLASVTCYTFPGQRIVTFSTPPSVSNGEFSFSGNDGVAVSGRIVSPSTAVGTIDIAPCTATRWDARKQI